MDTKDLKVFIEVYESKSINHAARKLFFSPQGCSKIIHKLENELGTTLFIRSPFGLEATSQGEALYRQARNLTKSLDDIATSIHSIDAKGYQLNIGSTNGIMEYLTTRFVKCFHDEITDIKLCVLEGSDSVVKARLAKGDIELGITGGPVDLAEYSSIPFTRHHPCIVVSTDNPLAKKTSIAYSDLDYQPIAMVSREFASTNMILNRFFLEHVEPDIVVEAAELSYCHKLAQDGEAIAISFDFAAVDDARDNTVIIPFEDGSFVWETFLIYKIGTTPSDQAQTFCEFATDWLEEHHNEIERD